MSLLAVIAKKSGGRLTGKAHFSFNRDFTEIDCFTPEDFNWHINSLVDQKLATLPRPPAAEAAVVQLTREGWNQVQPLPRPGGIPGRCFVAMWFDGSMEEIYELGIKQAVKHCGFYPVRIDKKEHNNQITDEMIAEIRDAEFLIADFSGHRGGVYYEAGFARALGRPVIHCCRDSGFESRHFDTRVINHIKWSDADDLYQKLTHRIKATIIPNT